MPLVLGIVKSLGVATMAFLLAMAFTPLVTHFLYRFRLGKRIRSAVEAPVMHALHAHKEGTPTMGGLVVWVPVLALALGLHLFRVVPFDFLSRAQTWLPLGALVASALVGLLDDYLNVRGIGSRSGGLRMRHRLLIFSLIALVGALWFYVKLDWDLLRIPFLGAFNVGAWYIPIFMFVIIATSFSVNQTDGLDGLAGGTLLTSFGAYGVIALLLGKEDLAALSAAIAGALLAFLWFNIYPARFIMGDTGSMSLGVTLGVVAMLTNQALFLPLIGIVFVIESSSSLLQMASKRFRGRKWLRSSPLHHHLEAVGWPEPKVVMRAWVVSMVAAALGVALAVLDRLRIPL